jgi:hypothetical protein
MLLRPLALLVSILLAAPAFAADLKEETKQAFAHYEAIVQARFDSQLKPGQPFLWIDSLPNASKRKAILDRLHAGEVVTERIQEKENGRVADVPSGLVHHWIGTVFIPDVKLNQVLAILEDYDHHKNVYKPDVVDSRLISHTGNDFKAYLRFYKKKIIGITLNTEHDAHYVTLSPTRAYSTSRSTHIAEVEDAGKADEREKPVGHDNGFLWALDSFWRLEEKDAGVYLQCEAITLTRDIPAMFSWLVKPFVNEVPKESLFMTLNATRVGLKQGAHRSGN